MEDQQACELAQNKAAENGRDLTEVEALRRKVNEYREEAMSARAKMLDAQADAITLQGDNQGLKRQIDELGYKIRQRRGEDDRQGTPDWGKSTAGDCIPHANKTVRIEKEPAEEDTECPKIENEGDLVAAMMALRLSANMNGGKRCGCEGCNDIRREMRAFVAKCAQESMDRIEQL